MWKQFILLLFLPLTLTAKQAGGTVLDGSKTSKTDPKSTETKLKPIYPERDKLVQNQKKKKQPSKKELQILLPTLEKENVRLRDEISQLQERVADEELSRERERYESIRKERRLRTEIRNLRKHDDRTVVVDEHEELEECPPLR